MLIKFTKMQSLGRDIMVVNTVTQKVFFSPDLIRRLAHRHFGVGFELMLLVEPPFDPDFDFHYRLFNCDGEELEDYYREAACCCMRFVIEHKLSAKKEIRVSSAHGSMTLRFNHDESVTVTLDDGSLEMTSSSERIYEGSLVI